MQIVAAADMDLADENLRHGHAAIGTLDHLGAPFRIGADIDFGELHVLAVQQRLGRDAIGAIAGRIDFDFAHLNGRFFAVYMGLRAPATTRANTSASTCAAPARSSARAQASMVAPEVSTSSMRISRRPATSTLPSAGMRKAPCTFCARADWDSPTCCGVALIRLSAR